MKAQDEVMKSQNRKKPYTYIYKWQIKQQKCKNKTKQQQTNKNLQDSPTQHRKTKISHHTAELCEIAEGEVLGWQHKRACTVSPAHAHICAHTVNVAMVSSIMHRHFMFMQFTGQDRAMASVEARRSLVHKPITDRAQTRAFTRKAPVEKKVKII